MSAPERPTRSLLPFLPRVTIEWARREDTSPWQLIDGSMLFVDISGFTKMSERLARHGKLGAEEVTEAIETCFDGLLALAYAAGGSLLKFGGDALLILFTGDAPRGPRRDVGHRDARATPPRRPARHQRGPGRAAHVGRRALGNVRLLPRGRVAPRAASWPGRT